MLGDHHPLSRVRHRQWFVEGAVEHPDYPPPLTRTGHQAHIRTSRKISSGALILACRIMKRHRDGALKYNEPCGQEDSGFLRTSGTCGRPAAARALAAVGERGDSRRRLARLLDAARLWWSWGDALWVV